MSDDDAPRERRDRGHKGHRRGPGLASALAGAGLLVVLGFALGVVGGLVLEEPDLLLDYVLGRTEQVAVGGEVAPAAAVVPDVAARPPSEAAPAPAEQAIAAREDAAPPAVEPAPEAAPPIEAAAAAAPAAVAALPPAGGFAVQVGAFAEASAAEQLARRLRGRGLPVYVAPSTGADTARWRVRVGPLSSRAEAEGLAARLEQEERLSTWVLAESPL